MISKETNCPPLRLAPNEKMVFDRMIPPKVRQQLDEECWPHVLTLARRPGGVDAVWYEGGSRYVARMKVVSK